jgi:hypothetical protein
LKVAFDDLVAWLGFLFQWDDIKRTHKVMKNILKLYAKRAVSEIDTLETKVQSAFSGLEGKVNAWAGIRDPGQTMGSQTLSSSQLPGINTPQANWALHQTKGNVSSASTTYSQSSQDTSSLDQLVQQLEQMAMAETSNLTGMVNQVKTQIVDNISTLTPTQVVQRLSGVIADLLIKSAETVIITLLDLLKVIANGLIDLLDAPIDIPIISSIYKSISGDALTILDLVCLIGAIPVTIIIKIVTGKAPYPDNTATQALINATDFATLSSLLTGGQQTMTKMQASVHSPASIKTVNLAAASSLAPTDLAAACLNIGALFGSIGVAFFAAKKLDPSGLSTLVAIIRYCSAACYVVYAAPSYTSAWGNNSDWAVVMNDVVTGVAVLKTFADNTAFLSTNPKWKNYISPFLEATINAAWLAPAIQSYLESENKPSDISAYISNVFFDIGGILTPGTVQEIVGTEVAAIIFAVCEVSTLGYGLGCVATGVAILTE